MPVTGAQVFKYKRLLRTFLKPLQVDTLFLGYSNLFATIMCIKTFVVHLNCMQYFCNLCVCVFVAHTYVCTVETPNQHCYLLHSLCTYSCLSIHSFIYLFVCLLIIWCVGVLLVCIPVQHHIPCSRGPEEGIRYARTGATGSCEPPCGFQKPNPGPLGEHLVLLAAESSLTHPCYVLRPVSH